VSQENQNSTPSKFLLCMVQSCISSKESSSTPQQSQEEGDLQVDDEYSAFQKAFDTSVEGKSSASQGNVDHLNQVKRNLEVKSNTDTTRKKRKQMQQIQKILNESNKVNNSSNMLASEPESLSDLKSEKPRENPEIESSNEKKMSKQFSVGTDFSK